MRRVGYRRVLLLAAGLFGPPAMAQDGGTFTLSVEGERLSVEAEQARLGDVLDELGRQTGIRVHLAGPSAQRSLAVSFANLEMSRGLRQLLRGTSYALLYEPGQEASGGPRVSEVRVLSTGTVSESGGAVERVAMTRPRTPPTVNRSDSTSGDVEDLAWELTYSPDEQARSNAEESLFREALEAPDPDSRVAAISALSDSNDFDGVKQTLLKALKDPDAGVRKAALNGLSESAGAAPIDAIIAIAQRDESPLLRRNALSSLAANYPLDKVIAQLKVALSDPDQTVTAHARKLLDLFDRK